MASASALAAAPMVSEESAALVTASGATVQAVVNPEGLAASYHAEYVTAAQFETNEWAGAARIPSAEAELPATNTPITVSETIGGLQPSTTYRFRYVATNASGSAAGASATLTTSAPAGSGSALPDGRIDELVSTSGNAGEPYFPSAPFSSLDIGLLNTSLSFQVAANGEAISYAAEPADLSGNGAVGTGNGNQWLAARAPAGWATEDISPVAASASTVYQGFTADLTTSFVEGERGKQLTAEVSAGCGPLYSRTSSNGALAALFTVGQSEGECGLPFYAGASEDASHVIFQDEAALTPNSQPATEVPAGHEGHGQPNNLGSPCMFGCNLYESTARHLTLVNTIAGHDVPSATFGGYAGVEKSTDFSNAISTDGSRVFWTDTQEGEHFGYVYVLEDGTSNVPVSSGAAEYWTATPDGHYAYYTEGGGLWRFDTHANSSEQLVGSSGEVEGVIGTSDDGAYQYFVAAGALAPGAIARNCIGVIERNSDQEEDETGEGCNLYVLHAGKASLVGVLSPRDNHIEAHSDDTRGSDWSAFLGERVAEVTPDGRNLIFESRRALTGYQNTYQATRQIESFVYEAESDRLSCISCDPAAAPPQVQESNDTKLPNSYLDATYMPRWLASDAQRAFFVSSQPLLPQDTNGLQDVYEWEQEGSGTCSTQMQPRPNGGCLFLLTGGESRSPSFLVGADTTGDNVFVEHVGPLGEVAVGADHNELYDLRVDGGFPHEALACSGTGCQGAPPSSPSFATPATATFSGSANYPPTTKTSSTHTKPASNRTPARLRAALKRCRRKRPKPRRASCERHARAQYGTKPHRANTPKRRTHR
jgi:hypothetical protein